MLALLQTPKNIAGIHLQITHEGYEVYTAVLSEEKGSLHIIETYHQKVGQLDDLVFNDIKSWKRCVLGITGKGILSKTSNERHGSVDDLLHAVFPNLKGEHVMGQYYIGEQHSSIAVVKTEIIDSILAHPAFKDLPLCEVAIGPFTIQSVAHLIGSQLEGDREPVIRQVGNDQLTLVNGEVVSINRVANYKVKGQTRLGDVDLLNEFLFAYTLGVQNIVPSSFEYLNLPENATDRFRDTKFRGWTKAIIKYAAISISVLAIVNAIVYMWAFGRHERLSQEYAANKYKIDRVEQLLDNFDQYKSQAVELGLFDSYYNAYFLNEIGKRCPDHIVLTSLKLFPIDERKMKRDNQIEVRNNTMVLEGVFNHPVKLNQWLNDLEDLGWINQVEEASISQDINKGLRLFKVNVVIGK